MRDHGLQPCLVVGQGAQLGERFAPGLAPALDDPGLALLLVRELQANAVRVEEVDRVGLAADIDRAEILDVRLPDSIQHVVELLLADRERHMLHRADRVAVAPRLGALRDLEEGEQRIAARIEKVVADVLERRVAAVARAGPQARRDLQSVHQRHAEDAQVEIQRHLHVVGVQRKVVHPAGKGL